MLHMLAGNQGPQPSALTAIVIVVVLVLASQNAT
jgi:hypothetical protein